MGRFHGGAHEVHGLLPALYGDAGPRPRRSSLSSAPRAGVVGTVLQGELLGGTGDRVVPVEAGAAQAASGPARGGDHRLCREVGERGGADVVPDLLHRVVRADELISLVSMSIP